MMSYVFDPAPRANLSINQKDELFPVRRVYCVGRNYAEHTLEMGGDPNREAPFFFTKASDTNSIVPVNANQKVQLPYPSLTQSFHHEIELVVAIGKAGKNISVDDASEHIYGYAVGLDMTRRDLQAEMKSQGRSWEIAKAFDFSAPVGVIHTKEEVGELNQGQIFLEVNTLKRQSGDLSEMVWSVNEIIANLSTFFKLEAGDLIMTGTPAGVGPVQKGDLLLGKIAKLSDIKIEIV